MNNLKLKWQQLAERERQVVIATAVLFSVLLVWFAIITPVLGYKSDKVSMLESRTELYDWLLKVGPQAKTIAQMSGVAASNSSDDGGALSSLVNKVARDQKLKLQRFENDGRNGLRIWFDDVEFDVFAKMMLELNKQGIVADQLSVESGKKSGIVNVRGVLVRQ
ncbi:type II secretion system protein GspM [Gynuella sunshinyii]|uniref:Type II secretion system protein M n=1 Tax=Gynuella sunshinyii YC6258 TaxID=1445510 RepID=A0A0C5VR41_9GAMM|nr:type II secretion system protein M [Gynuella sunshinyii]AJQ95868.1 type II secretory pathway, component PulM [Gynuella sunshinyii YC6258]